jgi:tyrosyl-tRNA synthetase
VPSDIQIVPVPDGVLGPAGIQVDKLVARIGLAESVSEARRRREAGAVTINGQRATDLIFSIAGLSEMLIQVGKQWRRVTLG